MKLNKKVSHWPYHLCIIPEIYTDVSENKLWFGVSLVAVIWEYIGGE